MLLWMLRTCVMLLTHVCRGHTLAFHASSLGVQALVGLQEFGSATRVRQRLTARLTPALPALAGAPERTPSSIMLLRLRVPEPVVRPQAAPLRRLARPGSHHDPQPDSHGLAADTFELMSLFNCVILNSKTWTEFCPPLCFICGVF